MTRPSHAALVEEVAQLIPNAEERLGYDDRERAQAAHILSLIAARLSDVTPEMVEALCGLNPGASDYDDYAAIAKRKWCAGLAASPLTPGAFIKP